MFHLAEGGGLADSSLQKTNLFKVGKGEFYIDLDTYIDLDKYTSRFMTHLKFHLRVDRVFIRRAIESLAELSHSSKRSFR